MNKKEFIEKLTKKLRENNITDKDEIIAEYEEHFSFKLADGYSEAEIAAKLGNPEYLAEQFIPGKSNKNKKSGKKAFVITGLVTLDIFAGMFFILLYAWVAVMIALFISSAVIGICLFSGLSVYSLVPSMPYSSSLLFAVSFTTLAVLSAVGTVYCAAYFKQLIRAYGRFHGNSISNASGKAVLPSLATHPKINAKTNRRLRGTALISLTIFAVACIAAYVVSAILAGNLEFWHVWHWFV